MAYHKNWQCGYGNRCRERGDYLLSNIIGMYYLLDTFQIVIKNVFQIAGAGRAFINYMIMAVMAALLFVGIRIIWKRNGRKFFIWETAFLFLYMKSVVINGVSVSFLFSTMVWTLGACIPLGVCACSVYNKEILLRTFVRYSYFQSALLWCLVVVQPSGNGFYNMAAGYALLIPAPVFYTVFLKEKKILYLAMSLVSTCLIFIYGSRGPLLGIAVFFLVNIFFYPGRTRKDMWIKLAALFGVMLVIAGWEDMLLFLTRTFVALGISSRTLQTLISGTIAVSGGREVLFQYYWEAVMRRPACGWGLQGGWIGAGEGPHNMLLEIVLAFGIPVGITVSVVLCLLFMIAAFGKKSPERDVAFLFACASFSMFLVDGDWLEKPKLFLFLMLAAGMFKGVPRTRRINRDG